MKNKKPKNRARKFYPFKPVHVFKTSYDSGVIFYDTIDNLTMFTIICVNAAKFDVTVMGISLMVTHAHELLKAETKQQISLFEDCCNCQYAKSKNMSVGKKGHVFKKRFGSAPKWSDKKIRNAISYLYNNGYEKGLAADAMGYQWSFLPYAFSPHPFSKEMDGKNLSRRMSFAINTVRIMHKNNFPLKHTNLRRLFTGLEVEEQSQLVDFIISTYSVIDYESTIRFYGSLEKMVAAIQSNTGEEYEIKEDYDGYPYHPFIAMSNYIGQAGLMNCVFSELPVQQLHDLIRKLHLLDGATHWHISKFLHIPVPMVEDVIGPALYYTGGKIAG